MCEPTRNVWKRKCFLIMFYLWLYINWEEGKHGIFTTWNSVIMWLNMVFLQLDLSYWVIVIISCKNTFYQQPPTRAAAETEPLDLFFLAFQGYYNSESWRGTGEAGVEKERRGDMQQRAWGWDWTWAAAVRTQPWFMALALPGELTRAANFFFNTWEIKSISD